MQERPADSLLKAFAAIIITMTAHCIDAGAQTLTAMRDSVKGSYNFWLYQPGPLEKVTTVDDDGRMPLIVFLHGKSLSGTDLSKVRKYGPLHALAMGRKIDAMVLAPQTSNGWTPSKVNMLVDWVIDRYPVDPKRIYVIGMSMGGYGTVDYVGTYPDRIAAAMAICGGGSLRSYEGLRKVPLWILHGTADRAVPIEESRKVIAGMKLDSVPEEENMLIFTELPGMDHSRPGRILYMVDTYEWLFMHRLDDNPRSVCRGFTIDPAAMEKAYTGLRSDLRPFKVIDRPNR